MISADFVYVSIAETVANDLQAIGLRIKVQPLERAAMIKANQEKKLKNLYRGGSAAFGNAATRIEALVVTDGIYDRAIFVPLFEPAFLNGYGPRVVESGLGLITYHGYSAPYEDVKLRAR